MCKPMLRLTPGCEHGCEACDVSCAVFAALRDDLWRELEQLHRERALHPHQVKARDLEAAKEQLANAEREFERARPPLRSPAGFAAWPGTSQPARPH